MTGLAIGAVGPAAGIGSSASVHHFAGAQTLGPDVGPPASAGVDPLGSTFKQLVNALQSVNGEQAALDGAARQMEAEGARVTPGEMVMLSMRCDEFMFHCQLTSNAASRSSDGLQELFKEQS